MSENKSPADVALEGLKNNEEYFDIFYKYQNINKNSLDALEKGYVYFSKFSQLNDPFDPFISIMSQSVENKLLAEVANSNPRIFCLTPESNNPLMWAHYANSGAGMCIGYAVFTGNPRIVNPVQYIKELPSSLVSILDMFTLKYELWSHEEEWRATWATEDPKVYDIFHPVSIILGSMCTNEDMERVKKIIPKTVSNFSIKYPSINNRKFFYNDYNVEEVVEEYGHLPEFIDLFKVNE